MNLSKPIETIDICPSDMLLRGKLDFYINDLL